MALGHRADDDTGRRAGAAALLVAAVLAVLPGPAPQAAPGDPPYVDQLMRLAEILGALHHLRPLCGANEAQVWRQKMSALLAAEEPSADERRRVVERFNQSYRSLAEIHRTCTPAASEIIDRYLAEGSRISREIVVRYGRP
jgi:uncharacterized protein (TIGR02301 family)